MCQRGIFTTLCKNTHSLRPYSQTIYKFIIEILEKYVIILHISRKLSYRGTRKLWTWSNNCFSRKTATRNFRRFAFSVHELFAIWISGGGNRKQKISCYTGDTRVTLESFLLSAWNVQGLDNSTIKLCTTQHSCGHKTKNNVIITSKRCCDVVLT